MELLRAIELGMNIGTFENDSSISVDTQEDYERALRLMRSVDMSQSILMPKINHISFDLDGTLIDSLPLMRESWTHATKKIGVDTPWIQFRENIGLQFEKICANLGLENVSNELADEYFGFNRENLHKIKRCPN